jgi:branched-chain amino acid transport system substrate-binding protein
VTRQAAAASLTVTGNQSAADGVFIGAQGAGADAAAAARFTAAARANPNAKLFGPSALDTSTFVSALGPGARHVYISTPGFMPADLNSLGQQFVAAFKGRYGHTPATQAIFGYEAMSAVLSVIHEAGAGAKSRRTLVNDFFAIKNRPSALGTYSINANGDTSIAPFVFSRLRGGALIPFAFVSAQG